MTHKTKPKQIYFAALTNLAGQWMGRGRIPLEAGNWHAAGREAYHLLKDAPDAHQVSVYLLTDSGLRKFWEMCAGEMPLASVNGKLVQIFPT